MTVTDQFKEYFRPVCEMAGGLAYIGFSDGNSLERLLADSRSEDIYPGLFCLRPRYRLMNNGAENLLAWFDLVFYIFIQAPADNYEEQDIALNTAEGIAARIYNRLREDNGRIILLEDEPLYLEPVSYTQIDSAFGYEIKLRLGLQLNNHML